MEDTLKLFEHYEQVYSKLVLQRESASEDFSANGELTHTPYSVTLDELTDILHCSKRNVKWVLKHMQEKKWIKWQAGRGRGNRSLLTFCKSLDELLAEQVQYYLDTDRWEQAAQLYQSYQGVAQQKSVFLHSLLSNQSPVKKITTGKKVRDILRFISYRPLAVLDPVRITRRTEQHMVCQIYEGLVAYNSVLCSVQPHLALGWQHDAAFRVWTFQLRKGILWHDGSELLAEDAVESFSRWRSISTPYTWMFQLIKRVNALGSYRIEFELECSIPLFHYILASSPFFLVKQEQQHLFGTGPFKLSDQSAGRVILESFSDYFRTQAQLDRIEIFYLEHEQGTGDKGHRLPAEEVNFRHYHFTGAKREDWSTVSKIDRGCKYLVLNPREKGPLQERRTREALLSLFNKSKMVAELGENRQLPTDCFFAAPLGHGAGHVRIGLTNQAFPSKKLEDGALCSELLALKEPLKLVTYSGAGNEDDGYWLQKQAGLAGVDIEVIILQDEHVLGSTELKKADLVLGEQWMNHDPVWTYVTFLTQEQSLLKNILEGTELYNRIQQQIAEILALMDQSAREAACLIIEQDMRNEQVFYPLYRWRQIAEFPKHVQGVQLNELGWVDYQQLWFKV